MCRSYPNDRSDHTEIISRAMDKNVTKMSDDYGNKQLFEITSPGIFGDRNVVQRFGNSRLTAQKELSRPD